MSLAQPGFCAGLSTSANYALSFVLLYATIQNICAATHLGVRIFIFCAADITVSKF